MGEVGHAVHGLTMRALALFGDFLEAGGGGRRNRTILSASRNPFKRNNTSTTFLHATRRWRRLPVVNSNRGRGAKESNPKRP